MGQDERSIVCTNNDDDTNQCHGNNTTLQIEDTTNNSTTITLTNNVEDDSLKKSKSFKSNHNFTFNQKLPTSEEKPICRICHCSNEDVEFGQNYNHSIKKSKSSCWLSSPTTQKIIETATTTNSNKFLMNNINDPFFLITPCYCTGTLQFVHHKCLQQWIRSSNHKYCELCKYSFKLKIKNKPFYQWECLNMSRGERRKLLFHVSFNLISMICVFWSIYVIAERASLELSGRLGWRFWIKMLVVAIGFICGIMFIFFQLKLYFSIFTRWKQYNQIIIIENVGKNEILSPVNIDLNNVNNGNLNSNQEQLLTQPNK